MRRWRRCATAAGEQGLPIAPHKLTPEVEDSFWVNLIGKGYPAPRKKFRWCTERLKIRPSNKFIRDVVRQNGEAILVLGTRKAESQRRAITMSEARGAAGARAAERRTRACRTRWSIRRSRTGPTTTSGCS